MLKPHAVLVPLLILLHSCNAPGGALSPAGAPGTLGAPFTDRAPTLVPSMDASPAEHSRVPGPAQEFDDQWELTASTYLWLASKNGVVDSATNLVLDDPEESTGAFLYFEGEYERRFGFIADIDLLQTEDRVQSVGGDIEIGEDTVIAELDGTWRPDPDSTLQFLAGLRILDSTQDIDFLILPTVTVETTQVDPVIGAQATWQLDDDWRFRLRTDFGGFGIDSDFTYQGIALFAW